MRLISPAPNVPAPMARSRRAHTRLHVALFLVTILALLLGTGFVRLQQQQRQRTAALQAVIDQWTAQHGSGYRIAVQTTGWRGVSASYQANVSTVTASTYKLFVAYAAYYQMETGKLSPDQRLSGGQMVETCLERAIVQSDNDCAVAVADKIGWSAIDQLVTKVGLTHTHLNNYNMYGTFTGDKQTTAADLALLLQKLQAGTLLNKTHTATLLGYMKRQVYRDGIPAGSNGATVADKVGFLDGATHDAAIVYGPKQTYVLVVLSAKGKDWANIRSLASYVYSHLNER